MCLILINPNIIIIADVEEVAFSYKHAIIVCWRGMDRITSLIKTKLRSENGGEMLFRGDITVGKRCILSNIYLVYSHCA